MPIKTFTSTVLSSSDMNTYLMNQAVITCTAATHPASPTTGMVIFETDTGVFRYWTGTVWRAMGGAGFENVGSVSATTSAGGSITGIAHGLSTTPAIVMCQYVNPNSVVVIRVTAKAATTFDVNLRDQTGGNIATTLVGFDWYARIA